MNIDDEIMALKLKVGVLMKRRGGYRISPSQWRQVAGNAIDQLVTFKDVFNYGGAFHRVAMSHLDVANDISNTLFDIRETLKHISMAQMQQAGIGAVTVTKDEEGGATLDFTLNDVPAPPAAQGELRRSVPAKEHKGAGVWEFVPPPPHTGVVLVCAPDDSSPLGMRCFAEAKLVGGERKRYPVTFTEEE